MKLENIEIDDELVSIKSNNTREDSNFYTVLVGQNGVGKTRIFENIIENRYITAEFNKIIFSTYSLFNRKIKHFISRENVVLSNFNSISIVEQVSSIYFENLLSSIFEQNRFNKSNFKKVMDELLDVLKLPEEPMVSVEGLTSMYYDTLITKVYNNRDNNNLETLLMKRKKYIHEFDFENMRNNGLLNFRNSKMFDKYKDYTKRVPNHMKYCYQSILCLKIMFMNNREINQNGLPVQNIYELNTIERLYNEYWGINNSYEFFDLINIDYLICKELEINYVSNLAFNIDSRSNRYKKLTEFSSGEFALFCRIMDLSNNISNNSLILIDEPETFLNPKWIFEFVRILKEIFKNKDCHFIIASQSPFIVGMLNKEDVIVIKKKNGTQSIGYQYNSNQTFGANIDEILKNVFNLHYKDNMVVQQYIQNIKDLSESSILESFELLGNLADVPEKFEVIRELSTEKNKEIIKEEISRIEKEHSNQYRR